MSAYTATLEKIVDSLTSLNRRIDHFEAKQSARREDAERVQRRQLRQAAYADTVERQTRFADFQSRADDALEAFSVRAPAPIAGESARSYAIRVLELAQSYIPPNNPLATVDLRRCDDATINVFRPQIFDAVQAAAWSAESVPPGQLRERAVVDPNSGAKQRMWVGQRSFVCDMGQPGRKARIRDPSEFLGRGFR